MSYDISLVLPGHEACEHCGRTADDETSLGDWSPTWNLGPMLRAAGIKFGHDSPMHGRPAGEWATMLRAGLAAMEADAPRFVAMNPESGWGSYDGILPVLRQMLALCERYPQAIGRTR